MKIDLEESEFNDFIIARAKSHHEIDTQIERLADEFQKNESSDESSDESHELEREECQDATGLEEMRPWGEPANGEARPILKYAKRKEESHSVGR